MRNQVNSSGVVRAGTRSPDRHPENENGIADEDAEGAITRPMPRTAPVRST